MLVCIFISPPHSLTVLLRRVMVRVFQSPASHNEGMSSIRGQIHMGHVAARAVVGQVTLREGLLWFPPPTYT